MSRAGGPKQFGAAPAFARAWTAFILALTVAPYLLAWRAAPAGFHFTWVLPPYPEDGFSYLAWSRQAWEGRWLFSLKYTALPHAPFLFQPFFLICGLLARATGLELGVVHLLMKSAGVVAFFAVLFKYLEFLRFDRVQSTIAAVLVGVSSGFGAPALHFLGGPALDASPPADLWLVDSNTLWSLTWNPLFPWSLALILLAVYSMDRATTENDGRRAWRSGAAAGLLALIHPYQLALLAPLLAGLSLLRPKADRFGHAARFLAAAAVPALYMLAVSLCHPLLRRHSALGEMPSAPPVALALGFGLPLLLALAGAGRYWKKLTARGAVLPAWIAAGFALAYAPLWFRAKLAFGLHVPICLLAGAACGLLVEELPKARRAWALGAGTAALLPLMCWTQVYNFNESAREFRENAERVYLIDDATRDALGYLRDNAKPEDVVFAPLHDSLLIAAESGGTVVWGHWAQSVDLEERKAWASRIFREPGLDDAARAREFWGAGVRYFYLDGKWRAWFDSVHPQWLIESSERVFANPEILIIRARR